MSGMVPPDDGARTIQRSARQRTQSLLPRWVQGIRNGFNSDALTGSDRAWIRAQCDSRYERDRNAALNLQRLTTARTLSIGESVRQRRTLRQRVRGCRREQYAARGDIPAGIRSTRARRSPLSAC